MRNHPLGIYEKALAKDLSWPERLVLAKSCGFDFVEMSVDETDERLSRLDWSATQRASLVTAMLETGVAVPSMCLSAHRRFPFGSRDAAVRQRAREIMSKAIRLARDLGIRTIQLAGYVGRAKPGLSFLLKIFGPILSFRRENLRRVTPSPNSPP